MDNNLEYIQLANAKQEADDYYHKIGPSPEVERVVRFFWWVVGGMLAATIYVTIWVTNVNATVGNNSNRVSALERTEEANARTASSQILAEAAQNSLIAGLRKDLDELQPEIEHSKDMWQMKIRGESNKEAFFREHGYAAPTGLGEPTPSPRK